jgi:hypothetical protein
MEDSKVPRLEEARCKRSEYRVSHNHGRRKKMKRFGVCALAVASFLVVRQGGAQPCEERESFIVVHGQSGAIATTRHQTSGTVFVNATSAITENVPEGTTEVRKQVFFGISSRLPAGGLQGWSLSASITGDVTPEIEGMPADEEVDPPIPAMPTGTTIDGTAAGEFPDGLRKSGFGVVQRVDPTKIHPDTGMPQGKGVVSAIVLSFTLPITLAPVGTATVLSVELIADRVPTPASPVVAQITWRDNMTGEGQPVQNVATVGGDTANFCECRPLTVTFVGEGKKPPPPEDDCAEQQSFIVVHGQSGAIAPTRHQVTGQVFVNETKELNVTVPAGTAGARQQVFLGISSRLPAGGLQGWSLSASITGDVTPEIEGMPADEKATPPIPAMPTGTTIDGTAAGEFPDGLRKSGFAVVQRVDPTKIHPDTNQPQGKGVVSAVVLSFTLPITLAPVGTATVLAVELIADRAPAAGAPVTGRINWFDNMTGEGQPVQNVATVGGDTANFCACRALTVRFQVDDGKVEKDRFIRGDPNDDGKENIADAIWIINELFRGGPATACQNAADANGDDQVNLSDAMYIIMHQFQGGAAPPAPFPNCGEDLVSKLACPPGSVSSCP